jgi:hypothetical protein
MQALQLPYKYCSSFFVAAAAAAILLVATKAFLSATEVAALVCNCQGSYSCSIVAAAIFF